MANPEDDLLSKLFLDVEAILATPGSSLSATGVSSADETLADLWHLWLSRISPLRESSRKSPRGDASLILLKLLVSCRDKLLVICDAFLGRALRPPLLSGDDGDAMLAAAAAAASDLPAPASAAAVAVPTSLAASAFDAAPEAAGELSSVSSHNNQGSQKTMEADDGSSGTNDVAAADVSLPAIAIPSDAAVETCFDETERGAGGDELGAAAQEGGAAVGHNSSAGSGGGAAHAPASDLPFFASPIPNVRDGSQRRRGQPLPLAVSAAASFAAAPVAIPAAASALELRLLHILMLCLGDILRYLRAHALLLEAAETAGAVEGADALAASSSFSPQALRRGRNDQVALFSSPPRRGGDALLRPSSNKRRRASGDRGGEAAAEASGGRSFDSPPPLRSSSAAAPAREEVDEPCPLCLASLTAQSIVPSPLSFAAFNGRRLLSHLTREREQFLLPSSAAAAAAASSSSAPALAQRISLPPFEAPGGGSLTCWLLIGGTTTGLRDSPEPKLPRAFTCPLHPSPQPVTASAGALGSGSSSSASGDGAGPGRINSAASSVTYVEEDEPEEGEDAEGVPAGREGLGDLAEERGADGLLERNDSESGNRDSEAPRDGRRQALGGGGGGGDGNVAGQRSGGPRRIAGSGDGAQNEEEEEEEEEEGDVSGFGAVAAAPALRSPVPMPFSPPAQASYASPLAHSYEAGTDRGDAGAPHESASAERLLASPLGTGPSSVSSAERRPEQLQLPQAPLQQQQQQRPEVRAQRRRIADPSSISSSCAAQIALAEDDSARPLGSLVSGSCSSGSPFPLPSASKASSSSTGLSEAASSTGTSAASADAAVPVGASAAENGFVAGAPVESNDDDEQNRGGGEAGGARSSSDALGLLVVGGAAGMKRRRGAAGEEEEEREEERGLLLPSRGLLEKSAREMQPAGTEVDGEAPRSSTLAAMAMPLHRQIPASFLPRLAPAVGTASFSLAPSRVAHWEEESSVLAARPDALQAAKVSTMHRTGAAGELPAYQELLAYTLAAEAAPGAGAAQHKLAVYAFNAKCHALHVYRLVRACGATRALVPAAVGELKAVLRAFSSRVRSTLMAAPTTAAAPVAAALGGEKASGASAAAAAASTVAAGAAAAPAAAATPPLVMSPSSAETVMRSFGSLGWRNFQGGDFGTANVGAILAIASGGGAAASVGILRAGGAGLGQALRQRLLLATSTAAANGPPLPEALKKSKKEGRRGGRSGGGAEGGSSAGSSGGAVPSPGNLLLSRCFVVSDRLVPAALRPSLGILGSRFICARDLASLPLMSGGAAIWGNSSGGTPAITTAVSSKLINDMCALLSAPIVPLRRALLSVIVARIILVVGVLELETAVDGTRLVGESSSPAGASFSSSNSIEAVAKSMTQVSFFTRRLLRALYASSACPPSVEQRSAPRGGLLSRGIAGVGGPQECTRLLASEAAAPSASSSESAPLSAPPHPLFQRRPQHVATCIWMVRSLMMLAFAFDSKWKAAVAVTSSSGSSAASASSAEGAAVPLVPAEMPLGAQSALVALLSFGTVLCAGFRQTVALQIQGSFRRRRRQRRGTAKPSAPRAAGAGGAVASATSAAAGASSAGASRPGRQGLPFAAAAVESRGGRHEMPGGGRRGAGGYRDGEGEGRREGLVDEEETDSASSSDEDEPPSGDEGFAFPSAANASAAIAAWDLLLSPLAVLALWLRKWGHAIFLVPRQQVHLPVTHDAPPPSFRLGATARAAAARFADALAAAANRVRGIVMPVLRTAARDSSASRLGSARGDAGDAFVSIGRGGAGGVELWEDAECQGFAPFSLSPGAGGGASGGAESTAASLALPPSRSLDSTCAMAHVQASVDLLVIMGGDDGGGDTVDRTRARAGVGGRTGGGGEQVAPPAPPSSSSASSVAAPQLAATTGGAGARGNDGLEERAIASCAARAQRLLDSMHSLSFAQKGPQGAEPPPPQGQGRIVCLVQKDGKFRCAMGQ